MRRRPRLGDILLLVAVIVLVIASVSQLDSRADAARACNGIHYHHAACIKKERAR